eukprot:CAMPEP_0170509902 /NCGR_PEP_ID=MMETSP0208-20121228/65467_1 /TAXON_ID=197538 /ORGANISM="Strombidium inclinatum, Strain S3" /LENGTH=95 /DNA_ID=CAMNT_0010793303 /DNA_START=29 /DNA_END=316 /DNA_ORIENTATION=-
MRDEKVLENWKFLHELTAVVFARAVIMGPLERMKVVMQTRHMTKYANPRSDLPKNFFDLGGKISVNQGMISFWRGTTPFVVMLAAAQAFRFYCYE